LADFRTKVFAKGDRTIGGEIIKKPRYDEGKCVIIVAHSKDVSVITDMVLTMEIGYLTAHSTTGGDVTLG
jgi:ABC-type lipoprotein export system ATPase subunit